MAEVFKKVNGRKITKIMAYHGDVQREITRVGQRMTNVAKAVLAAHHHDGHAYIEMLRGHTDAHIVLDDERGMGAAMTIEFGRQGGERTDENGKTFMTYPMDPVAPLRIAAGLGTKKVGRHHGK